MDQKRHYAHGGLVTPGNTPGTTTAPAPDPGPAPGPQQGTSALTPQEMAILDAAFTPEVLQILMKAFPELLPVLGPFMDGQQAPAAAGAIPQPTTGLGRAGI